MKTIKFEGRNLSVKQFGSDDTKLTAHQLGDIAFNYYSNTDPIAIYECEDGNYIVEQCSAMFKMASIGELRNFLEVLAGDEDDYYAWKDEK